MFLAQGQGHENEEWYPTWEWVRRPQGATSHDAEELREGFWVQEGDKEEQLAPLAPLWLEMEAVGELREVLPSVLLIIATTTAAASWSHRPTGASCCYPCHSKRGMLRPRRLGELFEASEDSLSAWIIYSYFLLQPIKETRSPGRCCFLLRLGQSLTLDPGRPLSRRLATTPRCGGLPVCHRLPGEPIFEAFVLGCKATAILP